ncbi:MAG: HAD family hydrolase, partial [Myxococcales bacterium]|nr:HAD family hydrolase [Myxococcales bacterium]
DFATSPLPSLLAARDADPVGEGTDWWARTARRYVFVVLGVTTAVAVGWWFHSHDLWRVLEVSTAVLVVTCPCAFGLAAPMAYELVLAGLRRSGIFVRSAAFLDRVARVRKVVFDKTGTVTTGLLGVEDAAPLAALSAEDAAVFLAMTQASAHPKSVAIGRALADAGALARQGVEVAEIVGRGLVALVDGHVYRVGETPWVMGFGTGASPEGRGHAAHPGADVALSRDGRLVATVRTVECLRNEAAEEIDALRRSGRSVYLLSGDSPARVEAMARTLGIASERALGAQRPDDKANWVRAHDAHDTLMIGDGLNDGPAVASAWCSGTPAVDRPFLAAHTDFYWTHPGLRPVTLTLRAGQELAQVLRRILAFAWSYNAIAIALAASGAMKPWMAAVLMPVSSIAVLIGTGAALGQKARLWKS